MDVCRQDIVQDICRQVLLMYGDLVAWVFRFQSGLFVPALDFLKVSAENLDTWVEQRALSRKFVMSRKFGVHKRFPKPVHVDGGRMVVSIADRGKRVYLHSGTLDH